MNYLHIIFYDNDFGGIVELAINRLYKWVFDNNAHCIANEDDEHLSSRSIAEMFHELHKADALYPMIARLIDTEYMANKVEFATRGLYRKTVDWERGNSLPPIESLTDDWLDFDIQFHETDEFTKEWQNGEQVSLKLLTGEVKRF